MKAAAGIASILVGKRKATAYLGWSRDPVVLKTRAAPDNSYANKQNII